jgi:hypothetical protein
MKDLSVAKFIMGMEIKRDREVKKLWLNQRKYIETLLKCFNMQDCKPVKVPILMGARLIVEHCPETWEEVEDMARVPYASGIGSIMYERVCTQPEISHVVGVLSRYMSTPEKEHWTTVKRVFRYLCGTKYYVICYMLTHKIVWVKQFTLVLVFES